MNKATIKALRLYRKNLNKQMKELAYCYNPFNLVQTIGHKVRKRRWIKLNGWDRKTILEKKD